MSSFNQPEVISYYRHLSLFFSFFIPLIIISIKYIEKEKVPHSSTLHPVLMPFTSSLLLDNMMPCPALFSAHGKWVGAPGAALPRWEPESASCPFYRDMFDPPSVAMNCLRGHTWLIIGDSVDYGMFNAICALLGVYPTLHSPLYGYSMCALPNGAKLVHTLICGSHEGPYFHGCASRFNDGGLWSKNMSSHVYEMETKLVELLGAPPSLVTIHFGVWDLATKYFLADGHKDWFSGYPTDWAIGVRVALNRIRNAFPNASVVVRGIGPTVEARILHDNTLERLRNRYVAPIAVATRALANDMRLPYADFFMMMMGMDEMASDGFHYDGRSMAAGLANVILNGAFCR
jgi:hypothetical protein